MDPLPIAMVGGGPGSFIGPVHARAAALDGRWKLVAGAFSRDARRAREAALSYGIDPARAYGDWAQMIEEERRRPDGARAIVIAAPNHLHSPAATAALSGGLAVISDKPAAASLLEAERLEAMVAKAEVPYALTHAYAAYPMVRTFRDKVLAGAVGTIQKVLVEYSQGWLADAAGAMLSAQARWRTDPAQAGVGGALGDIGVHAFHLGEFVTGLRAEALLADVRTVVAGRALDDDANVLVRFSGGASGVLALSQVAAGERNAIHLKVQGDNGTLAWSHDRHACLTLLRADGSELRMHAATDGSARLPTGHPEGLTEAFATLYREFADVVQGRPHPPTLPGIEAGVRGLRFVEASLRSSEEQRWTRLEERR